METASVSSPASTSAPEEENAHPGKKEPASPKISSVETAVRIGAIPVSLAAAYHYFHGMARDGIQDFFAERKNADGKGILDELKSNLDNAFIEADKHPDPAAIKKNIKTIIRDFDKGVTKLLRANKFNNSLDYFRPLERRKQLNIFMTVAAAFSITMGFFGVLADPRNKSAFESGWRKLTGKKEPQSESPKQHEQPKNNIQPFAEAAQEPAMFAKEEFKKKPISPTAYTSLQPTAETSGTLQR